MLKHLRHTLATGSLTKIVAPTCTVDKLAALPAGISPIEELRIKRVPSMQLHQAHPAELEGDLL